MGFTAADREALKKAIALGLKTVAYTDRRVEFRSFAEMLKTLEMMDEELSSHRARNRTYMSVSTGIRTE